MRDMRVCLSLLVVILLAGVCFSQQIEFKLLATNKTSTTQKEMQEAADAGFRFAGVMGGETSFGGSEVVTIMQRIGDDRKGRFVYKLLATSKTSTMQKELQQLGNEGFEYKGQTVFETAFGGQEVVVILELDRDAETRRRYEYLLLATKKTSTMQKELNAAGEQGYEFVGVTVSKTKFAGTEVLSILRRAAK
jgi:hypothetical protein